MINRKKLARITILVATICLFTGLLTLPPWQAANAGIYSASEEVVYKEIWIDHDQFTGSMEWDAEEGTCTPTRPWGTWYAEPLGLWNCPITMVFDIDADDLQNAVKAEIYIDLWRNRTPSSLRFTMNDGPVHAPDVGDENSRTPYVADFPLSELEAGSNTLKMWKEYQQFHVHDIAIRFYYDPATYPAPTGNLTQITADNGTRAAGSGGDLLIDSDQLTLSADVAPDAQYVEFHAYYHGYDEDNDGEFYDWHNLGRQNWHPGGRPKANEQPPLPDSGTINHIGTVAVNGASNVSITWDLPHIPGQSDVRFKIRVLDGERRVRDAAGGVSAAFNLVRTQPVLSFIDPDFEDMALGLLGEWPPFEDFTIVDIPVDPAQFDTAYLIGAYWRNPLIRINDSSNMEPFVNGADEWSLSVREFPISYLQQGANRIEYEYANGNGHLIEKPGPMIILKRTAGTPTDNTPPVVHAHNPMPDQTQVDWQASTHLELIDAGVGVDQSSIKMTVEGKEVTPQIQGDRFQYRLAYTPVAEFAPGQTVTVAVEACDFNQNCSTETYSFTVAPPAVPLGFTSDDFNVCSLQESGAAWALSPANGGTADVLVNGTQLVMDLPSGQVFDLLPAVNNAPRLLQSVNDAPIFVAEAKFLTAPTQNGQMQGMLVTADDGELLRFNFQYQSGALRVAALSFAAGGAATTHLSSAPTDLAAVSGDTPLYLRVSRDQATWTMYYRHAGVSDWQQVGQFEKVLSVDEMGVFAGNGSAAPAYTAVLDYVFNSSSPIDPINATPLILPVTVEGDGTVEKDVDCGNPVTLTAVAAPGWSFDSWSGVYSGADNPVQVTYNLDDEITATFTRDEYTLDVIVESEDHTGNTAVSDSGGTVRKDAVFPHYYGDDVTLTADPAPGWTFVGWYDDADTLLSNQLQYIITIGGNTTVWAQFAQETYNLTIVPFPADKGEIIIESSTADARDYFIYGDELTIRADVLDDEYHFVNWSGDLSSSNNPETIVVTGDMNITANFDDTYDIFLPTILSGP